MYSNSTVLAHPSRHSVIAIVLSCLCPLVMNAQQTCSITLKPLSGPDGVARSLEVTQVLDAGSVTAHEPLAFRVPIADFVTRGIAERIHGLTVSDSRGEVSLQSTDDVPSHTNEPYYRHWKTTRPLKFPLTIHYIADVQPASENGGPPYGIKAVGPGLSGSTLGFLVTPEDKTIRQNSVHWDLTELPTGSIGAITSGVGDVAFEGPSDKLYQEWILAGPARPQVNKETGFQAYALGAPPFDLPEALDWSDRAYATLRNAFPANNPISYILLFRSLPYEAFVTGTAFPGGALVNTGNAYIRGQELADVRNTLFHEMTHEFVGEIQGEHTWFSEGLTVYSSTILPFRNQLISLDEYVKAINRGAEEYYKSKARNWPEETIEADGTGDEQVRRVPYDRGELYFANLDSQIRLHSHGSHDLYPFLTPLFEARKAGTTFDQTAWEKALRR